MKLLYEMLLSLFFIITFVACINDIDNDDQKQDYVALIKQKIEELQIDGELVKVPEVITEDDYKALLNFLNYKAAQQALLRKYNALTDSQRELLDSMIAASGGKGLDSLELERFNKTIDSLELAYKKEVEGL